MINKKNVFIRTDFNIYNTKSLFNDGTTVKIPSWIVQDTIENNKNLLIKLNQINVANYTTVELKRNLITVESKVFNGKFKNKEITYNLCQIKVELKNNKEILTKSSMNISYSNKQ